MKVSVRSSAVLGFHPLVLAIPLFVLSRAAVAQPTGFFLDTGTSASRVTGTLAQPGFRTSSGTFPGLTFDVQKDLRFGSDVRFLPSARFIQDRYRVEIAYRRADFVGFRLFSVPSSREGAGAKDVSFSTNASVDFETVSFGFRYDVLSKPTWALGLGADADHVRYESLFFASSSADGVRDANGGELFGVPNVGFNLHSADRRLFVDLKAGGSVLSGDSVQKARGEAGWSFSSAVGAKVGWEGYRLKREGGDRDPFRTYGDSRLTFSNFYGGFFFHF